MDNRPGLFSLRMRAAESADGEVEHHLSGAERLVDGSEVEGAAAELMTRGWRADPDHLRLAIDRVDPAALLRAPCLRIQSLETTTADHARAIAEELLAAAGVAPGAIAAAFTFLIEGPQLDGKPIRGAVILDARTGERLDSPPDRGVRASRFDYAPHARDQVRAMLDELELGHFRTFEALAVATKVMWSGVTAELCWSDDPHYVAGYVATQAKGYVRLSNFKPEGAVGGRIFFAPPGTVVSELIHRLEQTPLWITATES
jgi:6-carboxyhexanoate--CoA ligase